MIRSIACAILMLGAAPSLAEPVMYKLDPSHSQVRFQYDHAGFSVTYGLIGGFEGDIRIDREDLSASTVSVSNSVDRLVTGDLARDDVVLRSGQFFDISAAPMVSFVSTSVLVSGDTTAQVSGDLLINGTTVPVVLDTVLVADTTAYPFPPFDGRAAVGFRASTTLSRSAFGLGAFAPFISDTVAVEISIEAMATR